MDSITLIGKQTAAELKQRRIEEATRALKDYEAERIAIRAKTERLRAARLAAEASHPPVKKRGRLSAR